MSHAPPRVELDKAPAKSGTRPNLQPKRILKTRLKPNQIVLERATQPSSTASNAKLKQRWLIKKNCPVSIFFAYENGATDSDNVKGNARYVLVETVLNCN